VCLFRLLHFCLLNTTAFTLFLKSDNAHGQSSMLQNAANRSVVLVLSYHGVKMLCTVLLQIECSCHESDSLF
jgi:hypothetical protein